MSLTDAFAKLEEAFGELKKALPEDDTQKAKKPAFGGKQAPPFPPGGGKPKKPGEEDEDGKKPPFPPKKKADAKKDDEDGAKKSLNDQLSDIEATIAAFGKAVEDDPANKGKAEPPQPALKGSMVYDGHPVIDAPDAGWERDMAAPIKKRSEEDEKDRDFGKDPWAQRTG